MRLLIIGGGRFLGRAFAAEALAAGHQVTVFNRGETSVDLPGVTVVRGDREKPEDLARLVASAPAIDAERDAAGHTFAWDAVIDTCGYKPKVVGDSARALATKAGAYVFISSKNAYRDWPSQPLRPDSPKFECAPDETGGEYGPLKAGCERAVRQSFPDTTVCLDAGLIIGPHEDSGRLTWWLSRIARGGKVLAPADPARIIAPIDARDIARFGLRCVEQRNYGAFVVCGPGVETFGGMLEACVRETDSGAELVWAPDELLLEHKVAIWKGLPLWAPAEGTAAHVWDADTSPAQAAGLVCRPIAETVRDTWSWLRDAGDLADGTDGTIKGHGLAPAAEAAVRSALTQSRS